MKFLHIKINRLKLFYLFVLVLLFSVFIILAYINVLVKKNIANLYIYSSPISFSPADFPIVENKLVPYISASGAVVIDVNSMVTLYEKNSGLRFSPASTTKIMTALVGIEHYVLDDELTIYRKDVEGTNLGFIIGEKFTFENLIYAMMLPSSNDAALAIAGNYPGGEEAFVARMNEKAKELNLNNSYFAEPVGLLDEEDYSTPLDLARLSVYALKNPEFTKVVGTKNITIKNILGKEYKIESLNILLGLPGISGVKTGTTIGAGQVLVTSKKLNNGKNLIFVVMQSEDRFGDTQILLNYLEKITFLPIHP